MECTPLVAAWGRSKQAPQASKQGSALGLCAAAGASEEGALYLWPLGTQASQQGSALSLWHHGAEASKGAQCLCGSLGQASKGVPSPCGPLGQKHARQCILPVAPWGRGKKARECTLLVAPWGRSKRAMECTRLVVPQRSIPENPPFNKNPPPRGFFIGGRGGGFFFKLVSRIM